MSFTISNLTNTELELSKSEIFETIKLITAYSPFLIIALGITGNPAVLFFIVSSKSLRKMSSMVILIFVSIVDTLSLFTWNLNHFFLYKFNIKYEFSNIYLCRIMDFIQYFSLQSSGFLLSLLTLDRYVTIASKPGSFISKLPFRTIKSSAIWSSLIICIIFILNSHILILNGYFDPPSYSNETIEIRLNESVYFINETISIISSTIHCRKYSTGFKLFPDWDQVNILVYSFIPTLLMFIFNLLIIYKITCGFNMRINEKDQKFRKIQQKKRNLTLSLLSISFFFLISSSPGEIFYGYFYPCFNTDISNFVGSLLDFLTFLNHSTLFYNLFFFNLKFRKVVFFKLKHLLGLKR